MVFETLKGVLDSLLTPEDGFEEEENVALAESANGVPVVSEPLIQEKQYEGQPQDDAAVNNDA